jgi:hypothetical protein
LSTENHITISGGDQRGAVIGNVRATQHNHGARPGERDAALEALRALLADSAPRIVALGRTPAERSEIERTLTDTRHELAAPKPQGPAVRGRWAGVLAILGAALAANADVAQITQFVMSLFS